MTQETSPNLLNNKNYLKPNNNFFVKYQNKLKRPEVGLSRPLTVTSSSHKISQGGRSSGFNLSKTNINSIINLNMAN